MTKKILFVFLLFLLGLYCSKSLFNPGFFYTHDLDHHLARSYEAIEVLSEGHFPLRWAGGLNYYCGVPVFTFFYPLFSYLIFLLHLLNMSVFDSFKVIAGLSLVLSPIFFYFFLEKETKNNFASFTGAVLYLFVPYRFLLIFVRGTPEYLAYTILPLLFFLFSSLFEIKFQGKKAFLLGFITALVGFLFIISHNIAVLISLPLLLLYLVLKIYRTSLFVKKKLLFLFFILVSILGLSSFFFGPALLEQNNLKLSIILPTYKEHFPFWFQLIRSPWGFGYSVPGPKDGLSFMVGYAQILVLIFAVIFLLIRMRIEKKIKKYFLSNLEIIFWLFLTLLFLFIMLPSSNFLWERLQILHLTQYPWRFLGLTSFTIAALSVFLLLKIKNRKILFFLSLFLIILAIYGNRNHLQTFPVFETKAYLEFETKHPLRRSTTTFSDEILNRESPSPCTFDSDFIVDLSGKEKYQPETERKNLSGSAFFQNRQKGKGNLKLKLEYFPDSYELKMNDSLIKDYNNCQGRVCLKEIDLREGGNVLEWRVVQTPVEKFFNFVSLLFLGAWFLLITIIFFKNDKK